MFYANNTTLSYILVKCETWMPDMTNILQDRVDMAEKGN